MSSPLVTNVEAILYILDFHTHIIYNVIIQGCFEDLIVFNLLLM